MQSHSSLPSPKHGIPSSVHSAMKPSRKLGKFNLAFSSTPHTSNLSKLNLMLLLPNLADSTIGINRDHIHIIMELTIKTISSVSAVADLVIASTSVGTLRMGKRRRGQGVRKPASRPLLRRPSQSLSLAAHSARNSCSSPSLLAAAPLILDGSTLLRPCGARAARN